MRNVIMITLMWVFLSQTLQAQTPTPFACTGSDGFGYYISSATETSTSTTLSYSNSRLSKLVTSTGNRTTTCTDLGRSMNGLSFNPHDNFLYAVSRYDPTNTTGKSGTLYRIGSNCARSVVPVTGSIIKFDSNHKATIDAAGGNIGSGTFDLDNNYYVNTSFTNVASTGFTNKIQKIRINSAGATVLSTQTMTCASCTGEVQVTDIIFDEATNSLIGSNFINKRLYKINASTGAMTPIASGTTGLSSPVLGLYKNRTGEIRAVTASGNIYNVNAVTGAFTLIINSNQLISQNADAASGCYAPPSISGHLFYDTNRLTDNTVNGTGTAFAGSTKMYANLLNVSSGLIEKSSEILADGSYQFLGLFSGVYVVQVSDTRGTIGLAPPAQNLPAEYEWTGDNIGAGQGSDGSPDGQIAVLISNGADITEVNFGIDPVPVTVPVDFVSFEAKDRSSNILLTWETENEINNDYFSIEKLMGQGNFVAIGKVKADQKYAFEDRNLGSDNALFYRLKQVDLNGNFQYSKTISLKRSSTDFIKLHSALVQEYLKFNKNYDPSLKLSLNILSTSGQLLGSFQLSEGENEISLANWNSGIYFYMILDAKGNLLTTDRFIKQ